MADTGNLYYKSNNKYRGCALIIVNENFWKNEDGKKKILPEMKRKGSSKDCTKMKEMFSALDFKVKVFKDLTAEEMKKKICKASQDKEFNAQSDCFALVISSHGEEVEEKKVKVSKGAEVWRHRVLGSDCNSMYIDEMMDYFKDNKAEKLVDKPKFFFLQACRSRHGLKSKKFDYGVTVTVATDSNPLDKQPTDAGDHGGEAVLKSFGDSGNIEDINASWKDFDEDEWTGDLDSSDADSLVDSDKDLSDAKGVPDSGYLPPSPDKELANPALPSPGEHEKPVQLSQDTEASTCLADKSEVKSVLMSSPEDQPDVRSSPDTGLMPPSPFEVVPINCPNDCILIYPVTSGRFAFRRADLGSRLLHCMHKEDNLKKLVQGCDFLQYITYVSGDMARVEISFEPDPKVYTQQKVQELKDNMPFKVTTTVVHRLQRKVCFKPKTDKSIMTAVLKQFKKMFN